MRRLFLLLVVSLLIAAGGSFLLSQEREDRTLLNWDQMRAIINEASGERSLHVVLEMVAYPRVRAKEEYTPGPFRESTVMARFAREYGLSNVEIEAVPQGQAIWSPSEAELWVVKPRLEKLYDAHDVAISIASGSESGDVTGDLVDVGTGTRPEDYTGKDVKGKIVLASGSASAVQRQAVFAQGAQGVLSYNTLYPYTSQYDSILSQSVSSSAPAGAKAGFGWAITPRLGRQLAGRLAQGEKITLRSIVKAETYPGRLEIVHATIPGDGSSDQAVVLSGHLYEGYIKQGANDDASGCAVTLEMGRTLIKLINEGKLPRPRRTIHFVWGAEISGTNAFLQRHPDIKAKLISDLNFDMEGLSLAKYGSIFTMHRTPDSAPTFLNDVGESLMRFIGELNQERVRYRAHGYGYTLPVVAPQGTSDPFYYKIEKFYGASDHDTYIRAGIPALMFITWPDPNYHSSEDTPDKLDPTQFKRVAVIGSAGAIFLASADDDVAMRAAAESFGRGAARMGEAQRKGFSYLADAPTQQLAAAYRDALATIRHQGSIEKQVVRSSNVLFSKPEEAQKRLAAFEARIDERTNALVADARALYQLQAEQRKAPTAEPGPTELEKEAASLLVESVAGAGGRGAGGGGGRGGAQTNIPQHMNAELGVLAGRKMTVLEIRDFLTGEFEPVPLEDVMAYFRAQEQSGRVKLTPKPPEPPPAPAPATKATKATKKAAKK